MDKDSIHSKILTGPLSTKQHHNFLHCIQVETRWFA